MTDKVEGRHAGEFLVSEANGTLSRETATVLSGQNLKAGEVVQKDGGGKLIAADGILNTAGDVVTEVAGIIFDNVDASAADVTDSVYIDGLAEVEDAALTYPTESTAGGEKVAVIASLNKLNIKTR